MKSATHSPAQDLPNVERAQDEASFFSSESVLILGRVPRLLRDFDHAQATLAAPPRGRFDDDLYISSKRVEPAGKPVDGDALHAATEHFGKRRLICLAEPRRFLLRQFAPLDSVLDGDYQAALGGEFRRLGRRESNIGKHVAAAFLKGNFSHCSAIL